MTKYKFVPQKKRSFLRIRLGCAFFTARRYFYWLKYNQYFAKISPKFIKSPENVVKDFPYMVYSHSSPLYRNLSKEDSILQDGKVQNLLIAIKKVNGVILSPGRIFSYWKLIGNPTKIRGYKKGMMLVNGKPKASTGGGLCALSNLLYWMILHSPLTVKERWRHSYDVFPDSNRTLPFGSGATCVYNYRDLIVQNQTQNDFIFLIKIENNRLCGEIRSRFALENEYEVYQKEHSITSEGPGIFVRHNSIFRKTINKQTKEIIEDSIVTENHALMMYNPFIEDNSQKK